MTNEQFEAIQLKTFIEVNGSKYLVESVFTKNAFNLTGKKGKTALLRRQMMGNGFRIEFSYASEHNQFRRFSTSRYVSSFKAL